ncbi:MAG TPA: hypothetical protein DDX71_06830 [Ruminococcus sp.]|nr:hypothetical protein [Ruminococcus sp.]
MNRKEQIRAVLLPAAEQAFTALFAAHPEHYYYCALLMLECATPCITAISEESLARALEEADSDAEEDRIYYKWSYAESPYTGFGYSEYFGAVEALFNQDIYDDDLSDAEYERRIAEWLAVSADVMETLAQKGVFGDRTDLFLNAEFQPPEDFANVENAQRLNSKALFDAWFAENGDEYEPEDS